MYNSTPTEFTLIQAFDKAEFTLFSFVLLFPCPFFHSALTFSPTKQKARKTNGSRQKNKRIGPKKNIFVKPFTRVRGLPVDRTTTRTFEAVTCF